MIISEKILKELRSFGSKTKATTLRRFFKTGPGEYGEGDEFLGVVVPDIRRIVKIYWQNISLTYVEKILHSKFHEERLLALLILVKKFQSGDALIRKSIYNLYIKNIKKYINNWDLVDLTAPHIVGGYLADKDKEILIKLANSKNLWERRVAMLATFFDIYLGDCRWAIKIAKILLKDKHDLIHKAAGWMLREVGKRCSKETLEEFLRQNVALMPRTMLRYSIERLPEERRVFWLKYKKK